MNWRIPEVRQRYTIRDTIRAGRRAGPRSDGRTPIAFCLRKEPVWRDGDVVSFRAQVLERDVIAFSNGGAVLRQSGE